MSFIIYILLCMILYSWCVVYPCYARSLHILLHWQRHTVLYIMFCSLWVICTKKFVIILECCPFLKRAMEAIEKWNRKKRIKKRGATLLSFIKVVLMFSTCSIHSHHLCSCLAPMLHLREFSCFTSITMWGILRYRTWVVYSNDELPQKCSRSSWATELDAPPLVPLESFHTHIALCASVAWQSLLLA